VGTGLLIDVFRKTPRDVFRRGTSRTSSLTIAPLVGTGERGGRIALRW
jgi:hypothetical protein